MHLPLISHEIPHSLAEAEAKGEYRINDYLFILLHRYIEDSRYRDIVDSYSGYKILDNSCFELGAALSNELIHDYVHRINPDVFVLPDTLGDKDQTISRSLEFVTSYPELAPKAMAVIQGDSYKEFGECYDVFDDELHDIAMIGIPFCFNWAFRRNLAPVDHAIERVNLLQYLVQHNHIRTTTKHHLLGTWWAKEFSYYRDYEWIYSVDTSNPIAAGIENMRYPIIHKPKPKFDEFVNLDLKDFNIEAIIYNVESFKEITKRDG